MDNTGFTNLASIVDYGTLGLLPSMSGPQYVEPRKINNCCAQVLEKLREVDHEGR